MVSNGIEYYRDKRILMLQGPMGPFFRRLSRDLEQVGATVFKINFNGGDWLFYPRRSMNFRGKPAEWPAFLENRLTELNIDVVLLFGDCRPVHHAVRTLAACRGIEVGVFEEGYIRPDFITLERTGTNGYSSLSRRPEYYRKTPVPEIPAERPVGNAFRHLVLWTILYCLAGAVLRPLFPHYFHHKPFSVKDGVPWIRSAMRKVLFRMKEKGIEEMLGGERSGKYFLVPLQVHSDYQIHVHSRFDGVKTFIEEVVESFSGHAEPDTLLVIKHHPMDRGDHDYSGFLGELARKHGLRDRLLYIHDQHLPTLLKHARGVVVINSTVGMSALHHGRPLKVCGTALYDLADLTWQEGIDTFWKNAKRFSPDRRLYERFRGHLIARTQLNGSFYKKLQKSGPGAGLVWSSRSCRWRQSGPVAVKNDRLAVYKPTLDIGRRIEKAV